MPCGEKSRGRGYSLIYRLANLTCRILQSASPRFFGKHHVRQLGICLGLHSLREIVMVIPRPATPPRS